eukprot:362502-Chlamydomonas_euryale.AAC.4
MVSEQSGAVSGRSELPYGPLSEHPALVGKQHCQQPSPFCQNQQSSTASCPRLPMRRRVRCRQFSIEGLHRSASRRVDLICRNAMIAGSWAVMRRPSGQHQPRSGFVALAWSTWGNSRDILLRRASSQPERLLERNWCKFSCELESWLVRSEPRNTAQKAATVKLMGRLSCCVGHRAVLMQNARMPGVCGSGHRRDVWDMSTSLHYKLFNLFPVIITWQHMTHEHMGCPPILSCTHTCRCRALHVWGQNDWDCRHIRTFDEGVSTPPRQKPSHSLILTGIRTRTTAHWAAAGSQRAATIPVIEAFNPYVNWPLDPVYSFEHHINTIKAWLLCSRYGCCALVVAAGQGGLPSRPRRPSLETTEAFTLLH